MDRSPERIRHQHANPYDGGKIIARCLTTGFDGRRSPWMARDGEDLFGRCTPRRRRTCPLSSTWRLRQRCSLACRPKPSKCTQRGLPLWPRSGPCLAFGKAPAMQLPLLVPHTSAARVDLSLSVAGRRTSVLTRVSSRLLPTHGAPLPTSAMQTASPPSISRVAGANGRAPPDSTGANPSTGQDALPQAPCT